MNLRDLAKRFVPADGIALLRRAENRIRKARLASMPTLTEAEFRRILADQLGLVEGDTVFVHSSIGQLNSAFPFGRVLSLLQHVVGSSGTLLFPTYPKVSSYDFLVQRMSFDVRKTPSYSGMLTELARRQRNAVRSLHPTKSVCAIGRYTRELTSDHQASPYPYDKCSPYYKMMELKGKIVGIGVSTKVLSFVHCVEDELRQAFPFRPYHEQLFEATCTNYEEQNEVIKTYAHDLRILKHNIPRYIRTYIAPEICEDLKISERKFFRARSAPLFAAMIKLAREGITIYPGAAHSSIVRNKAAAFPCTAATRKSETFHPIGDSNE